MIKKFLDSITPLRFAFFWALVIIAYMGWMICFLHETSTKFICLAMPTLEEAARVEGLSNNMTNYYTYCVVGPNYPANQDHEKIKKAMEAQHPSGTLDSFCEGHISDLEAQGWAIHDIQIKYNFRTKLFGYKITASSPKGIKDMPIPKFASKASYYEACFGKATDFR